MSKIEERAQNGTSNNLMKYAMWACCAVMFVPIALYFAAGGLTAGVTSNVFAFAPLLLCVGAHLAIHRFMGNPATEPRRIGMPLPKKCRFSLTGRLQLSSLRRAAHHLPARRAVARLFTWRVFPVYAAMSAARRHETVHERHGFPGPGGLHCKRRGGDWTESS